MTARTLNVAVVWIVLSACGDDDASMMEGSSMDDMPSTAADAAAPAASPGEFQADYRDSPEFFTLMSGLHQGMSPHGWQQTWYSSSLRDAVESDAFAALVGSVAIKEFAQQGEGPIAGMAVMVKREAGYDPDNGDWHYEMRDANGALMAMPEPGPIPDCIGCHQQFNATDYLGGTKIR